MTKMAGCRDRQFPAIQRRSAAFSGASRYHIASDIADIRECQKLALSDTNQWQLSDIFKTGPN